MKGVITIAKCSPVTISSSSPVGRVQCTCRQVSDQWRPETVVSTQLGQLLATVTLNMEVSAFQRDMKYCTQGKFNLDPGL